MTTTPEPNLWPTKKPASSASRIILLTGDPIRQTVPGGARADPGARAEPFAALTAPGPAWSAASWGDRIAGRRSNIVAWALGSRGTCASPVGPLSASVVASGGGASTRQPLKTAIAEAPTTTISGSSGRTTSTTRAICHNLRREAAFDLLATCRHLNATLAIDDSANLLNRHSPDESRSRRAGKARSGPRLSSRDLGDGRIDHSSRNSPAS